MRLPIIVTILAIVLACGCVDFDGQRAQFGPGATFIENPDMSLEIKATPDEVKVGRNITIQTNVTNKQNFELKNLNMTLYDMCIFQGSKSFVNNTDFDANRTIYNHLAFKAGAVTFDTDCELRFRTEYIGSLNIQKTIGVLKETEYYSREQQGKLGDISTSSYSSDNPLNLDISFSEPLPFIENDEVYMYIDYSYTGDGIIDKIKSGDVTMSLPSNMDMTCPDYTVESLCKGEPAACIDIPEENCADHGGCEWLACGGEATPCSDIDNATECGADITVGQLGCFWNATDPLAPFCDGEETPCDDAELKTSEACPTQLGCQWLACNGTATTCDKFLINNCSLQVGCEWVSNSATLNRDLTFMNKKASRSTCVINTKASREIDLGSLYLNAIYKYTIDNSIMVKVRPG